MSRPRVSCTNPASCTAAHYYVTRMYLRGRSRRVRSGLTLAQAREHCNSPETSSTTAKSANARRLHARRGPWFDGYEHERTVSR